MKFLTSNNIALSALQYDVCSRLENEVGFKLKIAIDDKSFGLSYSTEDQVRDVYGPPFIIKSGFLQKESTFLAAAQNDEASSSSGLFSVEIIVTDEPPDLVADDDDMIDDLNNLTMSG